MQLSSSSAEARTPALSALKARIRRLGLLVALQVLLAIPVVAAGYYLGGRIVPRDDRFFTLWQYAVPGVLLALFIAALVLTLRARRALKDTVMIHEELHGRIDRLLESHAQEPPTA